MGNNSGMLALLLAAGAFWFVIRPGMDAIERAGGARCATSAMLRGAWRIIAGRTRFGTTVAHRGTGATDPFGTPPGTVEGDPDADAVSVSRERVVRIPVQLHDVSQPHPRERRDGQGGEPRDVPPQGRSTDEEIDDWIIRMKWNGWTRARLMRDGAEIHGTSERTIARHHDDLKKSGRIG